MAYGLKTSSCDPLKEIITRDFFNNDVTILPNSCYVFHIT